MPHRNYLAATALGLCLLLACRSREPDGVALLGATLIDGTGRSAAGGVGRRDPAGPHRVGRVAQRLSAARSGPPEVDLTGRWIMPGLVDGHVHLVDPQARRRPVVDGRATSRGA